MQTKSGFRFTKGMEKTEETSGSLNRPQPAAATDEFWMERALAQAVNAAQMGEVPVGAVLVGEGGFLAAASNSPISLYDPTAHAEILALRLAAKGLQNYRLPKTTLYVTLEPCIMCMGALIQARVSRLVFGADNARTGAVSSVYAIGSDGRLNHEIEIRGGILGRQVRRIAAHFLQNQAGADDPGQAGTICPF